MLIITSDKVGMSPFKSVGSHVQLVFRTKFPTFTPDQFGKALKERAYSMVQGQVANPQNPQAPPIAVQLYSKGNINVFLLQQLNQIVFEVLNTVNLQPVYEEIKKLLFSLNIVSDAILITILNCSTRAKTKTEPQKNLTSLVNRGFLEGITKNLGEKLGVFSIRLATTFPLTKEGLQIVLEPLGTSPKNEYYLNITYRTPDMNKLNEFVERFGEDLINEIIGEVEKNV